MTRFIKRRNEIKTPKVKETKSPCIVCGKPSVGNVIFDTNSTKFPYCKKHDFDVQMYSFMLISGDVQDAESWISFSKGYHDKKKKG